MRRLPFILLLLCALAYAADENSFSNFFNTTTDFVSHQTGDFVDAVGAGGQTVPTTFGTVFDSFGPASCGDQWVTSQSGQGMVIGMWIGPAALAAIVIIIGISILYMLGQLFSSPALIALSKEELFQSALTMFRVGFLVATLVAADMWYGISAGGTGDRIYNNPNNHNMIDAAMGFSRLMVSDMVNHYSMLLMYNMVIHTIYSSTMWFGVTWRAMYSFNLGPVLRPLIDILGSALQFLSLGISEWLLHIVTLCLIKKWTWGLFIPLGMLLRAIPHTRGAGEAIFALTFALAVFYPFMFVFDYEVHKIMKYNIVDPQKAMGSFLQRSGILQVFGTVLIAMFLMAGVFVPFFLGGALTLAFELIKGAVYYIVIMSLIMPFINLFVTLTAARETAAFFKVDVNFMSFLKII